MISTRNRDTPESRRMAHVAHELTNPVSLISGSLENLQESLATVMRYVEATDKYLTTEAEVVRLRADLRLDRRLRDTVGLLEICAEGARRLTHLVAELRGDRRNASVSSEGSSDLRSIIDNAVAMVAYGRPRPPLVVVDCRPRCIAVSVDPQSLGQVVLNLVRNAFDATEGQADARVDIEARVPLAGALGAPRVEVSVRDNGPGIPTPYRDRIFAEGFSTKSGKGGLGLGLAISREIMTSLGGSIDLLSASENTEFLVMIPIADPPDQCGGVPGCL
jgi:signal transduction histidine kinase